MKFHMISEYTHLYHACINPKLVQKLCLNPIHPQSARGTMSMISSSVISSMITPSFHGHIIWNLFFISLASRKSISLLCCPQSTSIVFQSFEKASIVSSTTFNSWSFLSIQSNCHVHSNDICLIDSIKKYIDFIIIKKAPN